jgi:MurNAc alpha-1-phosphate uridylyltransferase
MGPKTAMVLAAGLGTRMRPLTNDRPKALVEVAGQALIDHVLDRLGDAGVETAVVNVHYFADRLEQHLSARAYPRIVISDERAELLETGGGLKKARGLLGDDPVWVANIDSVWTERRSALRALAELWDPEKMDVALLLAPLDRSLASMARGTCSSSPTGGCVSAATRPARPTPTWACTSPNRRWSTRALRAPSASAGYGAVWPRKAGSMACPWKASGCTWAIRAHAPRPRRG